MLLISRHNFFRSVVVRGHKAMLYSICKTVMPQYHHIKIQLFELQETLEMCFLKSLARTLFRMSRSEQGRVHQRLPGNIQESHLHICVCRAYAALPWSSLLLLACIASSRDCHRGRVEWWLCLPLLLWKGYTPWRKGHRDSSSSSSTGLSPIFGREQTTMWNIPKPVSCLCCCN